MSSAADQSLCVVERNPEQGTARLLMNRRPVNSLNRPMLKAVHDSLQDLAEDDDVRGVVLSSSIPGLFCAGLDITEMWKAERDSLGLFWTQLQDTFVKLYTFPKPIVAAVNGQSPAGGCLLAMACDYRVMLDGKYVIGLNEAALGIVAPPWLVDLYVQTVGTRHADLLLQLGSLLPPAQAEKIGLVDEVAADEERMWQGSEAMLQRLMKLPNTARHDSKMSVRRHNLDRFHASRADDVTNAQDYITSDSVQATLDAYMAALKAKSAQKKSA